MGLLSAALYSPDARLGLLSDRGAFDQYGRYLPGQMVTDGGVAYLCTAPVGTDVELEDTFQRPDQVGWGQSSHGEYWETSAGLAGSNRPSILGGSGRIGNVGEHYDDGQLLGPSILRADCELLLRVSLPVSAGSDSDFFLPALNLSEDNESYAIGEIDTHPDGTTTMQIQVQAAGFSEETSGSSPGPTVADRDSVWMRLRRVGLDYSMTLWVVGSPEPTTPQETFTAMHAQPAGHVGIRPNGAQAGDYWGVTYLSLRPLTAATAPGDDAAHWTPLSEALAVPAPL